MKRFSFFPLIIFSLATLIFAGSGNFLKEYQNYKNVYVEKSKSIRTRADYQMFKKWKSEELNKLLKMLENSKITEEMYKGASEVFFENKKYPEAIKYARLCIKSGKSDDNSYYILIESYLRKGNLKKAKFEFSKFEKKIKDMELKSEIEGDIADELMNGGKFSEASNFYHRAYMDSTKKDYKNYFLEEYLTSLYKSGNREKATKLMDEEIKKLKDSGDMRGAKNIEKLKLRLSLVGKVAPQLGKPLKWINSSKPITLKSLRGKVVILDFWAPWCPPCREEILELVRAYKKFHQKGLEIIGITSFYGFFSDGKEVKRGIDKDSEVSLIKNFLSSRSATWPIAIYDRSDRVVYEKYGVYGIPEIVFIGKDGKVKRVDVGFNSKFNLFKYLRGLLLE